jgi:hypothetical protein
VFVGLSVIGLLVIAVGAILLRMGIRTVQEESPISPAAIERSKQLAQTELRAMAREPKEHLREATEDLAERMHLPQIWNTVGREMRTHPYKWSLIAAGCAAAAGTVMVKRRAPRSNGS